MEKGMEKAMHEFSTNPLLLFTQWFCWPFGAVPLSLCACPLRCFESLIEGFCVGFRWALLSMGSAFAQTAGPNKSRPPPTFLILFLRQQCGLVSLSLVHQTLLALAG